MNYTFGGDVLDRNFVVVEFPTPFYTNVSGNISVPILIIAIFIGLFIQICSMFTPLRLIAMVLVAVVVALSATYILIHDILHY